MWISEKLEKSHILFIIINVIAGSYFFLVNHLTPLSGDDITLQNIFGTDIRVKTYGDIVNSIKALYLDWGGRAIVHFVDQSFLMYDKIYFNIANTIVFLFVVLVIYYCIYQMQISNGCLLMIYIVMWFCIPGVGVSIVWQTMSCNYLWGSALILACFAPYICSLQKEKGSTRKMRGLLRASFMLLLGFIAGWTIEAGGAMLLVGEALVIMYEVCKHKGVRVWQITGFIGTIFGYAALILAPGNFVRSARVKAESGHENIIVELAFRIARETYYMLTNMGLLIFAVLLLCLLLKKNGSFRDFVEKHLTAMMMFVLTFVGVYVMTFTYAFAERVLVTPIIFALISFGLLFKEINVVANRKIVHCIAVFGCVAMCIQAMVCVYQMRDGDRMMNIHTEYTEVTVELD